MVFDNMTFVPNFLKKYKITFQNGIPTMKIVPNDNEIDVSVNPRIRSVKSIMWESRKEQTLATSKIVDGTQRIFKMGVKGAQNLTVALKGTRPSAGNFENNWLPEHLRPPAFEVLDGILADYPQGQISNNNFATSLILGIGTFGTVKMVRIKKDTTETPFALKMISKWKMAEEWGSVSTAARALIREIEVLKRVRSPFVVNFFRCFHDDEYAYILLEFVNGGETSRLIEEEDYLSLDGVRFITAELVLTFAHLHSKGIIFRDLKPANVLFDAGGHIKVVDFGLAKIIDSDKASTVCGTLCYQAPEIILGKLYGFPVDWWAIGVVVFELQSKKLPFGCGDPFTLQQNILSESIDWPRRPKITKCLRNFLQKIITSNANRRFTAPNALKHKFLMGMNIELIKNRSLKPPCQPPVASTLDTTMFPECTKAESDFPLLAQKEKIAWNQELQSLMAGDSENDGDSKDKPKKPEETKKGKKSEHIQQRTTINNIPSGGGNKNSIHQNLKKKLK